MKYPKYTTKLKERCGVINDDNRCSQKNKQVVIWSLQQCVSSSFDSTTSVYAANILLWSGGKIPSERSRARLTGIVIITEYSCIELS